MTQITKKILLVCSLIGVTGVLWSGLVWPEQHRQVQAASCSVSISATPTFLRIGGGDDTANIRLVYPAGMSGGGIQVTSSPSGVSTSGSGSKNVTITLMPNATAGQVRMTLTGGKLGSDDCAGGSATFDIRSGSNLDCFSSFSTSPSPVIGGRSASLRFSGKYNINRVGNIFVSPPTVGSVSNITANGATFSTKTTLDERVSFSFSGWGSSSGDCAPDTFYASIAPSCPNFASVLIDEINRTLRVGGRAVVRAPNGWRWGQFSSYDPNVVTVNMLSTGEAEIIAVGEGTTGIYGFGFQSANGAQNCPLRAVTVTVLPPPVPPVCPDADVYTIALSKAEVLVGESSEVILPAGWYGGNIVLSGGSTARLQTSPNGKVFIVGLAPGTVGVRGNNFTADNGAVNCDLGLASLVVKELPEGDIDLSANPLLLCPGETAGSLTVNFKANVFYQLRVTGSATLSDNTVLEQGPPTTGKTYTTGPWVKQGTRFILVATLNNDQIIDEVLVNVSEKKCDTNPPGGNPPGGNNFTGRLYNTLTVPANLGSVASCSILAVWNWSGGADATFTVKNITTGQSVNAGKGSDRAVISPSNPQTISDYEIAASLNGNQVANIKLQYSPIAPTYPCGNGQPRFGNSNKDVVQIAGKDLASDPFAKAEANLPAGMKVYEGDLVRFTVNIINSGEAAFVGTLEVDDLFINLTRPQSGWEENISCGGSCVLQEIRYNEAQKRLIFKIRTTGSGLKPYEGASDIWRLSFNAVPKIPEGSNGLLHYFQNIASINGQSSSNLVTPKVPFLKKSQNPTIIEVQ